MSEYDAALRAVKSSPEKFHKDFGEWLANNWEMYSYFQSEAMKCALAGFKHIGSKMIIENLRYRTLHREIPGCGFKVNNRISPDLPRLFVLMHPEHVNLFEFRKMNSEATIVI